MGNGGGPGSRPPLAAAATGRARDPFERLRAGIASLSTDVAEPGGRVGAALAALSLLDDGDLEIVYTRRREDLRSHPGQISFPGGRVDPGETIEGAALREAHEEVALDPATVEILGTLPPLYIPPSRFWLSCVVARWHAPHALTPAEAEVAEVLHVRLSALRDPARWRSVRLSTMGRSWAWQLDGEHLLWGATGWLTATILELLDPHWHGAHDPVDIPVVEPWLRDGRDVPRSGPPKLRGVPELPVGRLADAQLATRIDLDVAGRAVADAVGRLLGGVAGRHVLVLAGPGGNGEAGRRAAARLHAEGARVVVAGPEDAGHPLPPADVVVDAVIGGGIEGALRGPPRDLVLALRHLVVPVVSLDLPSGLHPEAGLVGDTATADVTVAIGAPRAGLLRPGLAPFVGDLYVAAAATAELTRLVPDAEGGRARWAE